MGVANNRLSEKGLVIRQPLSRDLQKVMEQITQTSREEGSSQPGKGSELGVCLE